MELIGISFAVSIAILTVLLTLAALALPFLWAWMLIDSLLREEWEYPQATPTSNNRLVWALLIAFLQFPAVLYFFMVMRKVRRGSVARPAWAVREVPMAQQAA